MLGPKYQTWKYYRLYGTGLDICSDARQALVTRNGVMKIRKSKTKCKDRRHQKKITYGFANEDYDSRLTAPTNMFGHKCQT